MAEEIKNSTGTTETVKCAKCGKEVSPSYGKQKAKGFVCNDCLKKARRRTLIWLILLLLVLAIVAVLVLCGNDKKVKGFEGVDEIEDVIAVSDDFGEVGFNIAGTTVLSIPITAQQPISSVEGFKHVVGQAMEQEQTSVENKLEIPVIAITFTPNSDFLTKESSDLLTEVANLYNETNKESKLMVSGYASNTGSDKQNKKMARQRAKAVKNALVGLGIDKSKIKVQWSGKSGNADVVVIALYEKGKKVRGFEGVDRIEDYINVGDKFSDVGFNIATATISSIPVKAQQPISSVEEFKHVVEQTVEQAQASAENKLEIPCIAFMFSFDSDFLSKESNDMLDEITNLYNKTNRESTLVIDGFACNIGGDAANNYISCQRATAVKDALVKNGIPESNMKVRWFGKSRNSEFNLPRNADYRRVLISIE